jgi:hypothetical protein
MRHRSANELNQITVDAASLAGKNELLAPPVGRTLRHRLEERLAHLHAPGVLVVDFQNVTWVDSSVLLISVTHAAAGCRKQYTSKSVVCTNLAERQVKALEIATNIWHDVLDLRGEQDQYSRFLLLALAGADPANWRLLGRTNLNDAEDRLWKMVTEARCISVQELAERLGTTESRVVADLEIFFSNRVAITASDDNGPFLCAIHRCLSFS